MITAGKTKEIELEMGLHHGSALSSWLFVINIDVNTEEIEEGKPLGNAVCGRHGVVRSRWRDDGIDKRDSS